MASSGRLSAQAAERLFGEAATLYRDAKPAEAERRLNRLRAAMPDHPDVCHLLGIVRLALGRPGDALAPLRTALAAAERDRPDILPGVLNALGSALRRADKPDEAIALLRRAATFSPQDADVWFNLGNAQADRCRLNDAAACFREAARLAPRDAAIAFAMGDALARQGDKDGAKQAYEAAVALDPGHVRAHSCLGAIHIERAELAAGRAELERALALDPDHAMTHVNLGACHAMAGDADAALAATRRAIDLDPTLADAHSNLVHMMNYSDRCSADAVKAEARNWNARHAAALAPRITPPGNDRDPERRLKIGYVAGDFRVHPVGWFTLGLFAHHDARAVETFAYMTLPLVDGLTEKLRARVDHWRDAAGFAKTELADAIRADGIDILIDMAGHTAENGLVALAERPAPIQAVGGGVAGTTGVEAVDYILADRFEIPPGHERFYSESVVRLPDGYVCYTPPDYAPPVAPLPAANEGVVTFGCFNNIAKISPATVSLWARVLAAVPGARLLLKTFGFRDADNRARYRDLFAAHGVAPERLLLEEGAAHPQFLAAYGRVDVALDPTPYSGGLTTLEALWMGAPVVTLPGESFASRHSASHLSNAGLAHLLARDADDYVAIAARLANDRDELAALRVGLRGRVAQSPVCDGRRYARGLESAYRTAWRAWCRGEKPRGFDVPPPEERS